MRVYVGVIASGGGAYDAMKAAWLAHVPAPDDGGDFRVDVEFLYGAPAPGGESASSRDRSYDDVPESLVPGVLDKTLRAFRDALAATRDGGYDFFVRTNLSSWYHWAALKTFLESCPSLGLAAGFSPGRDHLSGCNLVVSRDVAEELVRAPYPRRDLDDLETSSVILQTLGIAPRWVSRVDLVYDAAVIVHGRARDAFHVRLKHFDRRADVALVRALVDAYDPGVPTSETVDRALAACGLPGRCTYGPFRRRGRRVRRPRPPRPSSIPRPPSCGRSGPRAASSRSRAPSWSSSGPARARRSRWRRWTSTRT